MYTTRFIQSQMYTIELLSGKTFVHIKFVFARTQITFFDVANLYYKIPTVANPYDRAI